MFEIFQRSSGAFIEGYREALEIHDKPPAPPPTASTSPASKPVPPTPQSHGERPGQQQPPEGKVPGSAGQEAAHTAGSRSHQTRSSDESQAPAAAASGSATAESSLQSAPASEEGKQALRLARLMGRTEEAQHLLAEQQGLPASSTVGESPEKGLEKEKRDGVGGLK